MNNLIRIVDEKLSEFLPIGMPQELFESMRYTVLLEGKRLRPVLCLEVCRMLGGRIEDAMATACAIEMLHAQTLIHDDLPCMDNDDFRRGKPSNHKVFGEAMAVLAGDALISWASQVILRNSEGLNAQTKLQILDDFFTAAGANGVIAGQVVDIESEGHTDKHRKSSSPSPACPAHAGQPVTSLSNTPLKRLAHVPYRESFSDSIEKLDFIHKHKTGDLFRFAICSGARIAGVDAKTFDEFEKFAWDFGLAFQIADDILDVVSDFKTMGKTLGKDAEAGKLTYVTMYGLDNAKCKLTCLLEKCDDIINKYNSEILRDILNGIRKRVGV